MSLTSDRNTKRRDAELVYVPLAAGAAAYAGGIAVADGGYAKPGAEAPGLLALGRFEESVDNSSGSDGDARALVRMAGAFLYGNSASDAVDASHVGGPCYIEDDETVAGTSGGGERSAAGTVIAVGDDGVWVDFGGSPVRVLSASKAIDFPSIAARSAADEEIEVPGAALGDQVAVGLPAAPAAGLVFDARVSEAGKVKLRASNYTTAAVDASSATYTVGVIKG